MTFKISEILFFGHRAEKECNVLPQEVMDATCANQFKNRLDSGEVLTKIWALKAWLNQPITGQQCWLETCYK